MLKNTLHLISLFVACCSSLLACAASSSAQQTPAGKPIIISSEQLGTYTPKTGTPYVIKGITYYPLENVSDDYTEIGIASWYGKDFHGKKTANGEVFNMHDMTAAHKTLPLPTFIHVKNFDNGKETLVRVNDRGPFSKGRILDLSYAAAEKLDMIDAGTARVKLTVLSQTTDHLRTENNDIDINKGAYIVQIGSFSIQSNATRLAANYANAAVRKAEVDSLIFYRVQLRGYQSKLEAEIAAKKFEKEYPGVFVIAE